MLIVPSSWNLRRAAASPADKEANWLPTPKSGEFDIVIRNHWPKEVAIDGTYKDPPMRKVR